MIRDRIPKNCGRDFEAWVIANARRSLLETRRTDAGELVE
jgi:hypothetical protein